MTATHAACDRRLAQLETQLADAKACCDTMRDERDAVLGALNEVTAQRNECTTQLADALAGLQAARDELRLGAAALQNARNELRRHAAAEASA